MVPVILLPGLLVFDKKNRNDWAKLLLYSKRDKIIHFENQIPGNKFLRSLKTMENLPLESCKAPIYFVADVGDLAHGTRHTEPGMQQFTPFEV